MSACEEAIEWCEKYNTLQEAWQACERAEWMMKLISKTINDETNRKSFVLISDKCTRLYLSCATKYDDRSLKAIEVVEAWIRGRATLNEVKSAAWLAEDAVQSIEEEIIRLNPGEKNVWLARAVVWLARTAAWSAKKEKARWSALAAARTIERLVEIKEVTKLNLQKECADITREYFPEAPKLKNKEGEKKCMKSV